MERWSEEMVPRRFADGKVGAAERQWMHEVQSRTAASSLLDAADLLMGAELTGTFRRIACPVLLLHPDSSPFLPMTVAADLLTVLPDARLQVFPGARHGIALSHAQEGARAFRDFAAA